jgi:hypothetical protein
LFVAPVTLLDLAYKIEPVSGRRQDTWRGFAEALLQV